HVVQMSMSGEKTPLLGGSVIAFEKFMTEMEAVKEKNPHLKKEIRAGMKRATKYYRLMDRTKAYTIAMFLHPSVKNMWWEKNWDKEYISRAK
ncbi:hypothetical protein BV25DRAFT_1775388, partial [Artomyces pyxidatus]